MFIAKQCVQTNVPREIASRAPIFVVVVPTYTKTYQNNAQFQEVKQNHTRIACVCVDNGTNKTEEADKNKNEWKYTTKQPLFTISASKYNKYK